MDRVATHVSLEDKRVIAEQVVRHIKDHALCDNKRCFNVIYLCSSGAYCPKCNGTFCEDCVVYCETCDDGHCCKCGSCITQDT